MVSCKLSLRGLTYGRQLLSLFIHLPWTSAMIWQPLLQSNNHPDSWEFVSNFKIDVHKTSPSYLKNSTILHEWMGKMLILQTTSCNCAKRLFVEALTQGSNLNTHHIFHILHLKKFTRHVFIFFHLTIVSQLLVYNTHTCRGVCMCRCR